MKREGRLRQTLGVAGGESSLNSPGTEELQGPYRCTDKVAQIQKVGHFLINIQKSFIR
jgi:hypothetical protein